MKPFELPQLFRRGAFSPREEMIRYAYTYRGQCGVEQICRVLARRVGGFMTSRGYQVAKPREPPDGAIRGRLMGRRHGKV